MGIQQSSSAHTISTVSSEDPARTVQTFIDLVQRHEQAFYTFVHKVHSKGQGLFDSLMGWIELFLNFARDGLPNEVDLEFILPYSGEDRLAIMRECDEVAAYYYKLKIAHEEKIRRRFQKDGASEEEAAFINGVVASLNMNDSIMNDAGEAAAGDESSDEDDEESDAEEAATAAFDPTKDSAAPHWKSKDSETASISSDPSVGGPSSSKHLEAMSAPPKSSLDRIRSSLDFSRKQEHGHAAPAAPPLPPPIKKRRRSRKHLQEVAVPPTLKYLPSLTPIFIEMVRLPLCRPTDRD
jgi:hypothetical protein